MRIGTYEVVLPYPGYRGDDESLLGGASRVTVAAPASAGTAAYAAASDEVLRRRGATLLALSDRPDESTVSPSGESLLDASMTIYGSDISAYLSRLS